MSSTSSPPTIICIGAGPAGLTAAYVLAKAGKRVLVLEKDAEYVGGISRTVRYKGFCFDIGGHRFFSKSEEVNELWREILGEDFLERPRKSRIYFNGKFFPYPLEIIPTLRQLGLMESVRCVASYVKAKLTPVAQPKNFEEWVTNRFGERLYRTFFKTYTEKVWGMPCTAISADWAAQRIRGLSLGKAVMNALIPQKKGARGDKTVKTLITTFHYPRQGPGMMWEAAARHVERLGGKVIMGAAVTRVEQQDAQWQVYYKDESGYEQAACASYVINSMPLSEMLRALRAPIPQKALHAAQALNYRDFLIVALIIKERGQFDDNWLYIHEPGVKVGRIQNFKSWSPDMVPDASLNCLGMEYFCFEGDTIWDMHDDALVRLACEELVKLGLVKAEDIVEGVVVRQKKAYPVYDEGYREKVSTIREGLQVFEPGLQTVGRAGMHQYNNQDHAMMTGLLAAQNILAGKSAYDVWNVNEDAEYLEKGHHVTGAAGIRHVPERVS